MVIYIHSTTTTTTTTTKRWVGDDYDVVNVFNWPDFLDVVAWESAELAAALIQSNKPSIITSLHHFHYVILV